MPAPVRRRIRRALPGLLAAAGVAWSCGCSPPEGSTTSTEATPVAKPPPLKKVGRNDPEKPLDPRALRKPQPEN